MRKKMEVIRAPSELSAELQAILDSARPEMMQKGDMTFEMARAHYGVGKDTVKAILAQLVAQGKLAKVHVLAGGHRGKVDVWRKPDKKPRKK